MSKFLKIALALASSFFVTTSLYAQATIEEVIVTAQRSEQSLQDVPIAVSAFTEEVLADRQIEYASDIQLQVPGVAFTATTFGAGGFSIRGITNLATAASADAGVEIHLNGLPLGATSVSEIQYLDMERLEVLRGPQGTLFGRNATGGVINLITAKPDLDEFYGSADIKYGQNNEKNLTMMLNVPVTDQLGLRFAYTNLQKDGVHENLYKEATDDFDNRDGYQWRASLLYEFDDTMRITAIHNAYDEESARNQVSGVWCDTGGSLTQGCVVGGNQVFGQISPMSNGSTLPSLLGGNLAFYFPGSLGCPTGANTGQCYNPLFGFNAAAAGANANALYSGMVDVPNIPNEFFKANVWRSPRHEAQESTSQLLFEKDFDEGQLTVAFNQKNRTFYRDTSSLSHEASSIRWRADTVGANSALYLANGASLGGVTGDATKGTQLGVPLGYSNFYATPDCDIDQGKAGVYCANGEGVRGYHRLPVSGDASYSSSRSSTYEIKYASDMDGIFNFLVGAISISNEANTFYNVYASGITMNTLQLPGTIAGTTRSAAAATAGCALLTAPTADCTAKNIADGNIPVSGIGIAAGLFTEAEAATQTGDFTVANRTQAQTAYLDRIARIDGLYTEYFHNETAPFILDSEAIFSEFYFNVADNHKLTLGLRYTQDRKEVNTRATFYDGPLTSSWADATTAATCGPASYDAGSKSTGAWSISATGAVTFNPQCQNASKQALTVGQRIGVAPNATGAGNSNGSAYLIVKPSSGTVLDGFNDDYSNADPKIIPIKEFSNTTGRLVWDWQVDDDTLMYISYAKGFKGGGFNPPFNAKQFPNTPFAFESTEVNSLEIGVKATVPEIGLLANASFYYNDFENYHLGLIRNETAINNGIPVETMGAELELLLNPPSVPGLTFNMQLSYFDSEIGATSVVNPHDLGGHYNGTAESKKWHTMKSATANSFLVNKENFGYIYGNVLQYKLTENTAYNTDYNSTYASTFDSNLQAAGVSGADAAERKANATTTQTAAADTAAVAAAKLAGDAAANTAIVALGQRTTEMNEFAMAVAGKMGAAQTTATAAPGATAATIAAAVTAARNATDAAGGLIIDAEMNAPATAYGTRADVCHYIGSLPGGVAIDTCLPAGVTNVNTGGSNVAAANAPSESLIYSPETVTFGGVTIAGPSGTLLPSIGILDSGDALQTGGLCILHGIFQTTAIKAGVKAAGGSSWNSSDGIVLSSSDPDGDGTNEADTCYNTATTAGALVNSGLSQSLEGNSMPFSDITLSMGIAYTFQTNNLEVTPRLDYYYRSDAPQNVFNIQQNKVAAWDEINFRLNIVPTDGDWRIIFFGQNLTDERNVTATAITNSSQSHTNTVFVREPRSFGIQFGIDF